MKNEKIAVFGGGNGAQATAAHLALMGNEVNLYDLPQFAGSLKKAGERGEIELTDAIKGVARLNLITTDIKEALKGVSTIFVVARSNADVLFAEVCAPHLEDGQIIILGAGNCGSLDFANVFKKKGVQKNVLVAEMPSLPYGCRLGEPARPGGPPRVRVFFTAPNAVGVFPAKRTDEVVARMRKFYPDTIGLANVVEAGMQNPNPIVHCGPALLNIGRIERVDDFKFYYEGFSKSVIKTVLTMAGERQAVCKAYGWKTLNPVPAAFPKTSEDFLYGWAFAGCQPRESLVEIWMTKGPMEDISKARYVTEDVPYGLVTTSSLGRMVGVKTPTIDSVVQMLSVINGVDYVAKGRTVEVLGLAGLSARQVNDYLYNGK